MHQCAIAQLAQSKPNLIAIFAILQWFALFIRGEI
jgi:hypothetical protein